jgi:methylglutaconyl-CoA hydratase
MSSPEHNDGLVISADHEVSTITIDVPATRNALSVAILESLLKALRDAQADPGIRVVVLTATGEVFSSGANLKELGDPSKASRLSALVAELVGDLATITKPVVCRVNGDAYGAGLAILSTCDVIVATNQSWFSISEVRFSMVPTIAAASCIGRIGMSAALDLMLTGRKFDAEEAAAIGLITEATGASDLDSVVGGRVDDLLSGDAVAIGLTKRMIRDLSGPPLSELIETALTYGEST